MKNLNGKIAVVTGGSSGIGLATARLFVERGAYVYITGRRAEELKIAESLIGRNVTAFQGDVSSSDDMERLYQIVGREKGHLDIVFANAGIGDLAPLGALNDKHIDSLFNVNVKGVIYTVQKALPLLRPGSSIVLNASIVASKGFPNWSVYSATKAAVRSFARTWSSDLKGKGIRVNAVSPGVIVTPGHGTVGLTAEEVSAFLAYTASITPLEKSGSAEDVANVVAFLASDDSKFIAGVELFVDGGFAQI